jgi:hypothetical protein
VEEHEASFQAHQAQDQTFDRWLELPYCSGPISHQPVQCMRLTSKKTKHTDIPRASMKLFSRMRQAARPH